MGLETTMDENGKVDQVQINWALGAARKSLTFPLRMWLILEICGMLIFVF